jgi:hypothetical protein
VAVYHLYGGEYARELSYWDDTGFQMGSQWVSVWWTHPRYNFEETCKDRAYDIACAESPDRETGSMFEDSTPIFKKLGKNGRRKKAILWQMPPLPESKREFFDLWDTHTKALLKSDAAVARPKFRVQQYDWCRGVEISCPVEVLSNDDLVELCKIVRECLNDRSAFDVRFGDYVYTSADWAREHPDETKEIYDHAVK